jgi:hypothetical protein
MLAARERLSQLLTLAAERRWTPLARELADLVVYWPADYPAAMQAPVLALFETALREADDLTQRELSLRLTGHPVPLKLMNALYLAAPAPQRREILMRNELEAGTVDEPCDAGSVLAAARKGGPDFAAMLSRTAAVPYRIARCVLDDETGEALAVLCRGLKINRAVFSAIALLRAAKPMPLDVFDTVPDRAAAAIVHGWRKAIDQPAESGIAAAE